MAMILSRRAALVGALAVLAPLSAHAAEPFLIAETGTPPNPRGNVLEVAAAQGQFQTFLRAVETAGYQETLSGEGPFTVFAPTDEAFRAMGDREVARLMRPAAHEELLALLAYHVVAERVTTASLRGRIVHPQASNGYRLDVDGRDGLRVNDQLVVMPDVEASNGVLQGVNAVLQAPVLVASR